MMIKLSTNAGIAYVEVAAIDVIEARSPGSDCVAILTRGGVRMYHNVKTGSQAEMERMTAQDLDRNAEEFIRNILDNKRKIEHGFV